MRIGIFHDYFGAIGGGEKTVLSLAHILNADIITTDTDVFTILNPQVPVISLGKTIKKSPFKQISTSILFSHCDFRDEYDFFIFTGNWSIHGANLHHPNLWYCYTPVRAFYDNYQRFLHEMSSYTKPLFISWVSAHRRWSEHAINSLDTIISISETVAERMQKYLNRKTPVIYPPVDCNRYSCVKYGDFWLSVNRLYPEKRIELQVETFRSLPDENLIIVGGYSQGDQTERYAKKILSNLPDNVSYLGEINEGEVLSLYATCKGHITTAMNEDFGLTPVEAMASGKPVVAVCEGGYRETINNETGILTSPKISALCSAIRQVSNNPESYKHSCFQQASRFDTSIFSSKMKKVVHDAYSNSMGDWY